MIRGLYSATTSLQAAEQNHEVVAYNLAHVAMPGYRRRVLSFETFEQSLQQASTVGDGVLGTQAGTVRSIFEPGAIEQTGRPLDAALSGDAFFVLDGPNGPLYTRNGNFDVAPDGELRGAGGLAVRGTGGRLVIPPGSGAITIGADGAVLANDAEIGKLQLARFDDTSVLRAAGATLFEAPPGVRPSDATDRVQQGFREGSNVQAVDELVRMIEGMRHYEASQRALRTISDAIEQNTRPQAT